jgi:hypothetical protein
MHRLMRRVARLDALTRPDPAVARAAYHREIRQKAKHMSVDELRTLIAAGEAVMAGVDDPALSAAALEILERYDLPAPPA